MSGPLESLGLRGEPPAIVVTGFSGAGKTTVGRSLAEVLGLDFVDTDTEIAEAEGQPVSEIIERRGEPYFRGLEKKFCLSLEKRRGVVVATGGGTLVDESLFELFSRIGRIVLLEAEPPVLAERIERSGERPLLSSSRFDETGLSLEDRIRFLLGTRAAAYGRIAFRVNTSQIEPAEAASRIAAFLDIPCRTFEISLTTGEGARAEEADRPLRGRTGAARVDIGRGCVFTLGKTLEEFGIDTRVFFLSPRKLAERFVPRLAASLDRRRIPYSVIGIDDGDERKTLDQAGEIIDRLIAEGARRDATIVPVGGGVTGDIGGFVSSIYMRGVALVHVPTTLLAQVDSSVGGKVAVNHRLGKNLIGNFYQPHAVLIDPCTLLSLPPAEVANGMAEVIKSALVGSPDLFEYLENRSRERAETRFRDIGFLETCVLESTRIKTRIVAEDPFEKDTRRTLNLGHTVGHALEASTRYRGMKHGEAVSVGIMTALRIARSRGLIDERLVDRTNALLEWCGLPVGIGPVYVQNLRESIRVDKKIKQGKIHYVLLNGLGSAIVVDDVSEEEIIGTLEKGAA
jgi:shikimate kinase/3-dehydroquinate synthase